jgi:predicted transcriptional regulator
MKPAPFDYQAPATLGEAIDLLASNPAGQLSDLITTVQRALDGLGQPNHPEELRTPAVSVQRSVQ